MNGRNEISWEEKFKLDVNYVDNITFMGDWKIIFKTLKKVVFKEGINDQNDKIIEYFKGTG